MKFRATIRKEAGAEETRVIDAPTRFALYEQVQQEGGMVTELTEVQGRFRFLSWFSMTIGRGVKDAEIIQMTKNLSAMLTAGLSISRALSVVERQTRNKRLRAITTNLMEAIRTGSSFHDALAVYPNVFPKLFVAMARAGEESGSLAGSLAVVGTQMAHTNELKRKIRGAMIYPSIVLGAVFVVGILMLIYVIPTLTATFTQLGVAIPLATRVIIAISGFMVTYATFVFLALAGIGIGGFLFLRSRWGSALLVTGALYVPVIGHLARETYAARTARTLSSLLSAGVPVLDALAITKEVVQVRTFARVIGEAEVRVKKGEPLSASFAEHARLYPILMSEMLAVGEETGTMAEMLRQVAEFYEADVAEKTKDLSSVIEPVLILCIGAFVGIFAVSIIAPIYSLSSAI